MMYYFPIATFVKEFNPPLIFNYYKHEKWNSVCTIVNTHFGFNYSTEF